VSHGSIVLSSISIPIHWQTSTYHSIDFVANGNCVIHCEIWPWVREHDFLGWVGGTVIIQVWDEAIRARCEWDAWSGRILSWKEDDRRTRLEDLSASERKVSEAQNNISGRSI
jgi:hypothetical protein